MKALTLYDPWATLVVLGEKQFETRSWSTSYRGLLAIHTSKNMKESGIAYSSLTFREALGDAMFHPGCIIGTVEVVGCWPTWPYPSPVSRKEVTFGDWRIGRFAWKLANPRRLAAPISCTGHLGLWTMPPEIAEELARQRLERDAPRF